MSVNIETMSVEKSLVRGKSTLVFRLTASVLGKSESVFRLTGSLLWKRVAVFRLSKAVSVEAGLK
jgi:hypothetical protein